MTLGKQTGTSTRKDINWTETKITRRWNGYLKWMETKELFRWNECLNENKARKKQGSIIKEWFLKKGNRKESIKRKGIQKRKKKVKNTTVSGM